MFHRNNEPGRVCDGCRYWSEMIAKSDGNGLEAYCLNRQSAHAMTFVNRHQSCDQWADGSWGAIDQPGGDPYAEVNP